MQGEPKQESSSPVVVHLDPLATQQHQPFGAGEQRLGAGLAKSA